MPKFLDRLFQRSSDQKTSVSYVGYFGGPTTYRFSVRNDGERKNVVVSEQDYKRLTSGVPGALPRMLGAGYHIEVSPAGESYLLPPGASIGGVLATNNPSQPTQSFVERAALIITTKGARADVRYQPVQVEGQTGLITRRTLSAENGGGVYIHEVTGDAEVTKLLGSAAIQEGQNQSLLSRAAHALVEEARTRIGWQSSASERIYGPGNHVAANREQHVALKEARQANSMRMENYRDQTETDDWGMHQTHFGNVVTEVQRHYQPPDTITRQFGGEVRTTTVLSTAENDNLSAFDASTASRSGLTYAQMERFLDMHDGSYSTTDGKINFSNEDKRALGL